MGWLDIRIHFILRQKNDGSTSRSQVTTFSGNPMLEHICLVCTMIKLCYQ